MPRRTRIEIEGGLYHLITRGVDRQDIFHCPEDYARFIKLLTQQKERLPYFLYAYCLMTNHVHLLIERMTDDVGRIMQRVLTGYAQYYNRRYRRVGHVLQGRHKAILCQSDTYLTELIRYIHLNPVRAKMVAAPAEYPYSSHRAYVGLEPAGIVDIDPVLRRFAVQREQAVQRFEQYVRAGMKLGTQEKFYATEGGVLGSEVFVDAMIHRIGEHDALAAARRRRELKEIRSCDTEKLIAATQEVLGISRDDLCSSSKAAWLVDAKETLILSGRRLGVSLSEMSSLLAVNASTVSRRYDSARHRVAKDHGLKEAVAKVMIAYEQLDG